MGNIQQINQKWLFCIPIIIQSNSVPLKDSDMNIHKIDEEEYLLIEADKNDNGNSIKVYMKIFK